MDAFFSHVGPILRRRSSSTHRGLLTLVGAATAHAALGFYALQLPSPPETSKVASLPTSILMAMEEVSIEELVPIAAPVEVAKPPEVAAYALPSSDKLRESSRTSDLATEMDQHIAADAVQAIDPALSSSWALDMSRRERGHHRGSRALGSAEGAFATTTQASALAELPARAAVLVSTTSCDDLFPGDVAGDAVEIAMELKVFSDGHSELRRIVHASTQERGFLGAASACARRLHFSPAYDESGRTVASKATIQLQFRRGSS